MAEPWFVRVDGAPRSARPSITTLQGPEFVEDYFKGIKASPDHWNAEAWSPLVRYRDYAEPPEGMLDKRGRPVYTVTRLAPRTGELLSDGFGPAAPSDGVPNPVGNRPPWLRKLYLPVHQHFHMVTCEVECNRPGRAPLDTDRVLEVGMVVRRLVADKTKTRWADWIDGPEGGLWVEVAGDNMRFLPSVLATQPLMDPAELPSNALGSGAADAARRALLGLKTDDPVVVAVHTLARVPPTMGTAGDHAAYFGYLPVSSAKQERPVPEAVDLPAIVADRKAELAALFVRMSDRVVATRNGDATMPPVQVGTPWGIWPSLDNLIGQLLPAAPGNRAALLLWIAQNVHAQVAAVEDRLVADLRTVLTQMWAVGDSSVTLASAWWDLVTEPLVEIPQLGWLNTSIATQPATYRSLLRSTLEIELLARARAGQNPLNLSQADYDLDIRLFGAALLRRTDARRDPDPEVENAVEKWAAGFEQAISSFAESAVAAGAAYGAALEARANAWTAALEVHLPAPSLLDAGIDVLKSPASGTLLFPTIHLDNDTVDALEDEIETAYDNMGDELLTATEALRSRPPRAQYDPDSLYAVWCYARVAGKCGCEDEEIVWSDRSDVFALAEPDDILGAKPVTLRMPDLSKLARDLPKVAKARALPIAAVSLPQTFETNDDMSASRKWGLQQICSFGIPVFTICAWILFKIIFSILIIIPGFMWMLFLRFCIPIPKKE